MTLSTALPTGNGVPINPGAGQARQWLENELAKPEYQAARPTWFDRAAGAVWNWIQSLTIGGFSGPPALGVLILLVVVIVAVVIAFLIFGVPRLRKRSTLTGTLFGAPDVHTAETLRARAERLAAQADYSGAIAEMFRAIARGLAERAILTTSPGTTARGFAGRAADEFPDLRDALTVAAVTFDEVRYLGRPGSAAAFDAVAALERQLRTSRPRLEPVAG